MTWPQDGLPRFKTTDPYGVSGQMIALVLDRGWNHHVAARCEHNSNSLVAVAARAAAKAARLNLSHDPWYQPHTEEAA